MPEILKFPSGFLWGSAVAAYQVEGGIENCDWSRDYPAGRACDYYNRYEQYFDMAKGLNQNIHRFSLEWSRIEPEEGKFNREAIEHYRIMLLVLKARGIKSMVTIWHWTNPVWFAKKGGWESSKSVELYEKFIKFIIPELDDLVDFWITLNEPDLYLDLAYGKGKFPPYKKSVLSECKAFINFIRAHKKAYKTLHNSCGNSKVGIVFNYVYTNSKNANSFVENAAVKLRQYIDDWLPLYLIGGYADYLGINYYFHDAIEFTPYSFPFFRINNDNKKVSDIGWEIYPEGIYHVLKNVGKRFKVPLYITENGIADKKDANRKKFIRDHLYWTHKAISEGVDVKGYLHWSLLDNFEWIYGFTPKFGLIKLDFNTFDAKIRPSAYEYAKICKNNFLKA